jgi:hypothetical protein
MSRTCKERLPIRSQFPLGRLQHAPLSDCTICLVGKVAGMGPVTGLQDFVRLHPLVSLLV